MYSFHSADQNTNGCTLTPPPPHSSTLIIMMCVHDPIYICMYIYLRVCVFSMYQFWESTLPGKFYTHICKQSSLSYFLSQIKIQSHIKAFFRANFQNFHELIQRIINESYSTFASIFKIKQSFALNKIVFVY